MSQPSTSVDLGQLGDAIRWLEQIKQFIETHCLGAMPAINEALGMATNVDMSDVEYRLTRQATVFGGFYSAYGMQAAHDGIYRAVHDSLTGLAEHLAEAARAVEAIMENYRAVEERNIIMGQNIERALEPFGLDVQQTAARLAAYHRVENTYLSTFQALGGLGLVLGTFGLVAVIARNVLERRRELALLGAFGFSGSLLQRIVAVEHTAIVLVGLAIGLAAALIAVAPVALERSRTLPWGALLWLAVIGVLGMLTAWWATRSVRRLPLVASLRSE